MYSMLYEKRKNKEPRKDRSPLEIEYEKNIGECTFKPNFISQGYYSKKAGVVSPRIDNRRGDKAEAPGPNKPKLGSNYTTSKVKRPEDTLSQKKSPMRQTKPPQQS